MAMLDDLPAWKCVDEQKRLESEEAEKRLTLPPRCRISSTACGYVFREGWREGCIISALYCIIMAPLLYMYAC